MLLKRLAEVVADGKAGELTEAIGAFSCKDKDVENFLKNKALEHERRRKSRTYLLLKDVEADSPLRILAYFTLSLKILTFNQSISKTAIKEIDGFNKNAKAVPTLLIGQFGKDELKAKDISGDYLLEICLNCLGEVQDRIGGRIVLAECLPIEAVKKFYIKNGFSFLQTDERDKYHQMILPV